MREIPVSQLKSAESLPSALLHKSGIPILHPGDALTDAMIAAIRDEGVTSLFQPEANERLDDLRRFLTHVSMEIGELNPGDKLARTVYDDEGHLLLEAGAAIPKSFAESLEKRGISKIYFRKPEEEVGTKVGRKLRSAIEGIMTAGPETKLVDKETLETLKSAAIVEAAEEDFDALKLEAKINAMAAIECEPTGEPFEKMIRDTRKSGPASEAEKNAFSSVIEENLADLRDIYKALGNGGGRKSIPQVDKIANSAMAGLIRNRELLMLCGASVESTEDYLVNHALAMTVISVNVGSGMKYDMSQIKSLAYGAMLAGVGMTKVPREILEKKEKLSPREYAEIRRHPAYGLDILQKVTHLPQEVPYVVYQCHERANGTGYPCGKKDVVIHPFAKIVGVADIYSSVCSSRPYREAKTQYEAMEQLVLMCGKRQLNADIVRAFLKTNSMFPVGSFVRLNDNRFARVIAANPKDYMRPLLAVLSDARGAALAKPERIELAEHKEINVTQALARNDVPGIGEDPMLGF